MTESTFSWVARSCWTAGLVPTSLSDLLGQKGRTTVWPSLFEGTTETSAHLIDRLQEHTHTPSLRCGSFSSVSSVAGKGFLGTTSQWLRWCPACVRSEGSELYIPLLFSMTACRACPIHGCLIESRCRCCGAGQRKTWEPRKWRECGKCGASLASEPRYQLLNGEAKWVMAQCEELVLLVSRPDVASISGDSIFRFLHELEISMAMGQFEDSLCKKVKYMLSHGFVHRMRFSTLLDFSSMLGVGVVDILQRPFESASLLLLSAGSEARLGAKFSVETVGAERLASVLSDGAWFSSNGYVPSVDALLGATRLRRSHFEQVPRSVIDRYDAFERQCLHPRYMHLEVGVKKSTKIALAYLTGRIAGASYTSDVKDSTPFLRSACEEDIRLVAVTCLRIATHWVFSATNMTVDGAYREAVSKLAC